MKKILIFFALASSSFTSMSQADISTQTSAILSNTKNLLIRIAESKIEINSISLDDRKLVTSGIISEKELNEIKSTIKTNGLEVKRLLGGTGELEGNCKSCGLSDEEKTEKLKSLISFIRNNKEEFLTKINTFNTQVVSTSKAVADIDSGPNCSFAFYMCLAAGSSVSGGIAVALVIYLCACEYCELKPPGCR